MQLKGKLLVKGCSLVCVSLLDLRNLFFDVTAQSRCCIRVCARECVSHILFVRACGRMGLYLTHSHVFALARPLSLSLPSLPLLNPLLFNLPPFSLSSSLSSSRSHFHSFSLFCSSCRSLSFSIYLYLDILCVRSRVFMIMMLVPFKRSLCLLTGSRTISGEMLSQKAS